MAADIMRVASSLKERYVTRENYLLRTLRQAAKGRPLDLQQVDAQALLLSRQVPQAEEV